jgi:hypothetical protein
MCNKHSYISSLVDPLEVLCDPGKKLHIFQGPWSKQAALEESKNTNKKYN